jgi:hypothetical protein
MVGILAGVDENGSSFARMPTHVAIGLRHEWGTRLDGIGCVDRRSPATIGWIVVVASRSGR